MKDLPRQKKLVPISEAAKILGVSIDTIRRWDSEKKLHSQRPNGKDRYFAVEELEKKKFAQPFSISEAAKKLGISQSTLRRLETRGIIKPLRDRNGERFYTLDSLQNFLNSEYFLRKQEIATEVLAPLQKEIVSDNIPPNVSVRKIGFKENNETHNDEAHKLTRSSDALHVLSSTVMDNRRKLLNLITFQRINSIIVIFLSTAIFIIILILTILFLLFPEDATIFLGYNSDNLLSSSEVFQKQHDTHANERILGASDN